ncbi:MAG: UrcA family protein [Parasphingopyxis sp.]|uniref:UrcA family protein n=1 Tax=Parasphingopyxis sp. TaxID=1920299 RepID=UPI003FA09C37
MKNLSALLIPATLVFGAMAAQPAVAGTTTAPSIAVSHADLDLSVEADRNVLERRLQTAAREVCGTGYAFDPRSRNAARECQVQTLESITIPMPGVVASAE